MELAAWIALGGGLAMMPVTMVLYHYKKITGNTAGGLFVGAVLTLFASGIMGVIANDQGNDRKVDALRVFLSQQGYNVMIVAEGDYTYKTFNYDDDDWNGGWNAYVGRRSDPACVGNIKVVEHGDSFAVVDDLVCTQPPRN